MLCLDTLGSSQVMFGYILLYNMFEYVWAMSSNVGLGWIPIEKMGSTAATS